MTHDPSLDHTLDEEPPTEMERSFGVLTAGMIALLAMATAIYWVA